MNILVVSSEAVPYVQTGGLGDVVGTLSKELAKNHHNVSLVIPYYRNVKNKHEAFGISSTSESLSVEMGTGSMNCGIFEANPTGNLRVFFIEYNEFYDRPDIYGEKAKAYSDNGRRFAFLCKAALELAISIEFQPDIVHINDWQTSLISYYLKTWYWNHPFFENTASVLTIHNMGYQGATSTEYSRFIGLNWMQMRTDEFEDHGQINLLKGGIFYADSITTVSPTYAKEILSEPGGSGLSPYLSRRSSDVVGILNGIDETVWNCETDKVLPKNYSADDLSGKAVCKKALQEYFGLKADPDIPVFGMVGRMAYQKGLQLLMDCSAEVLNWELQLVALGTGEPYYTDFFEYLLRTYPDKVGIYIGFGYELSHLIEAGSDFFIMPSLYEPCGLNQIYSMLYGTLPIVRSTGGLADTVQNFNEKTLEGTGFVFNDITGDALKNTIGWALSTWYNNRKGYKAIQQSAMRQSFSWSKAVKKYEEVFDGALERKKNWR